MSLAFVETNDFQSIIDGSKEESCYIIACCVNLLVVRGLNEILVIIASIHSAMVIMAGTAFATLSSLCSDRGLQL